jgi:uncharacterized protein YegP (UPF0339 family)
VSAEFSRRVDVYISKAEPLSEADWYEAQGGVAADGNFFANDAAIEAAYRRYLDRFQPYSWHAKAANHEITCQGESYFNEDDAINAFELMFGDDTTVYWAPMYGEDRGYRLLRYGKTDRDSQAGD